MTNYFNTEMPSDCTTGAKAHSANSIILFSVYLDFGISFGQNLVSLASPSHSAVCLLVLCTIRFNIVR